MEISFRCSARSYSKSSSRRSSILNVPDAVSVLRICEHGDNFGLRYNRCLSEVNLELLSTSRVDWHSYSAVEEFLSRNCWTSWNDSGSTGGLPRRLSVGLKPSISRSLKFRANFETELQFAGVLTQAASRGLANMRKLSLYLSISLSRNVRLVVAVRKASQWFAVWSHKRFGKRETAQSNWFLDTCRNSKLVDRCGNVRTTSLLREALMSPKHSWTFGHTRTFGRILRIVRSRRFWHTLTHSLAPQYTVQTSPYSVHRTTNVNKWENIRLSPQAEQAVHIARRLDDD